MNAALCRALGNKGDIFGGKSAFAVHSRNGFTVQQHTENRLVVFILFDRKLWLVPRYVIKQNDKTVLSGFEIEDFGLMIR